MEYVTYNHEVYEVISSKQTPRGYTVRIQLQDKIISIFTPYVYSSRQEAQNFLDEWISLPMFQ